MDDKMITHAETDLGEAPRILVADDDPAVGLLAESALAPHGFAVEVVADGEAALQSVLASPPDLLLLDVMMPGKDGFEVLRAMRGPLGFPHMPIVMATALEDTQSVDRAFREGATDFITKPIQWTLLRHRLQYVLRASRLRERVAVSEERYALAARGANDGLWDWDLVRGEVYYSPRWCEMLGLGDVARVDGPGQWLDRVHPDDAQHVNDVLETHIKGLSPHFETEFRLRAEVGEHHWVLCRGLAVRDGKGRAVRMAGSITDVTDRRRAEEQLAHDALHDVLTGLPNRTLFLEKVWHCLRVAGRREDYTFAVGYLDIDRFKNINDSLGHLAGDEVLLKVSERLQAHLRATDTLARMGGDEFTILFDDTPETAVLTKAVERLLGELRRPFFIDGQEISVTASIGITLSGHDYLRAEDMIRDADTALYRAKAAGRDCYEIFDHEMHVEVRAQLKLENELRHALDRTEMRLHYQPIVDLQAGGIVGYEALVRWEHPDRGLLSPAVFLPVAEESGLIVPLGRWVLREACRQLRQWRDTVPGMAERFVAINFSTREFAQLGLVEMILRALHENGLPSNAIRLEITESVLIDNPQRALEVMRQLRSVGIELSIDDFGSGYSSLNYLHRYPFNTLKIDREFVRQIDGNDKSREIVRAIVVLAHSLGLSVVAEGSESSVQTDELRQLECEFGQGYHLGMPLAPGDVERLQRALEKAKLGTSNAA
jgi:diguanylate cyclase (GGDEF)-like protein/PAS domain S-box-containing protein